jgi:hypothetical protein
MRTFSVDVYWRTLVAAVAVWGCVFASAVRADRVASVAEGDAMFGQGLRVSGAVDILADPGPLTIRVCKRDLNIYPGADVLMVRIVSPDRRVVETLEFPDDGTEEKAGVGPVQIAEATLTVDMPGLWKVDFECWASGNDLVYGMETTAAHYVFESTLLFKDPGLSGDIVFPAPREGVNLEITPQAIAQTITLYDSDDQLVKAFEVTGKEPNVEFSTPDGIEPSGLWRLHIPRKQLGVKIEGVTFFPDGSGSAFYPSLPYWTDRRSAWFDVGGMRWALRPLHRRLFRAPGESFESAFTVYNAGAAQRRFVLTCVGGDDVAPALGGVGRVWEGRVGGGEEEQVALRGSVPGDAQEGDRFAVTVRIASPEEPRFSTYARVDVQVGAPPAEKPLDMPIRLRPYEHENALFGYEPEYITNAPYFDRANRPVIRWRGAHRHKSTALEVLETDGWRRTDYRDALEQAVPGFTGTYFAAYALGVKTAFDRSNGAYTLLSAGGDGGRFPVLLHSGDGLHTWQGLLLDEAGRTSFEIEQFTGHNRREIPPPVLLYRPVREHSGRWATYNELVLVLLSLDASGRVVVDKQVVVSDRCVGVAAHSGGAAASVTLGTRTHIAWGEVVDEGDTAPGVPTYVATYDHETATLGKPVLLSYGAPLNDVHNSPGIAADSKGYLHVISGAHGQPFMYSRSLEPNTAYAGWTEAVPVLASGRREPGTDEDGRGAQTYLGLVCTPDDTLHIAYRQWRANVDPYFGGRLYAALSHQRKPAGADWEEPRVLVVPPLPDYSVYYHKLTVDRLGRLYVGYSYYSVYPHYRHDVPGRLDHQAVIMSADGGESWRLARTRDFAEGMEDYRAARSRTGGRPGVGAGGQK